MAQLSSIERDELTFGTFHAFRDVIEINGARQKADGEHGKALWLVFRDLVYNIKPDLVGDILNPFALTQSLQRYEVERHGDVSIYKLRVE